MIDETVELVARLHAQHSREALKAGVLMAMLPDVFHCLFLDVLRPGLSESQVVSAARDVLRSSETFDMLESLQFDA